MIVNDAHCHFFSQTFFGTLASQRGRGEPVHALTTELGWEEPGDPAALAERWTRELNANGVRRAVLIASVPGDEASVAAAVAAFPSRFVGFFMVDPAAPDAATRTAAAFKAGLRGLCLFPAMHHVPLSDPRTVALVEIAAETAGTVVFVHCGVLSVAVRRKLALPSRFDMSLGNPLLLQPLATAAPNVSFVVPHFGAGLFREALMLGDTCPNVYLDTSSSNGWIRYHPGLTLHDAFAQALEVMSAKRLLFGTDSSFFPRGWQRRIFEAQREILAALDVPPDQQALVFGGNFDRLFQETA
jgi:predicted TIM-barrel fold metal-dependent hydrolase